MQKAWWIKQEGVILVDVLLATSLFALLVTAVVGAVYFGAESSATSGMRARAVLVAEEGLEAARAIRDKGYTNLTSGTHGLAISGNEWTFSGTSDTLDQFTRSVAVTTIDTVTSLIVSTVTWTQTPWRVGSVSLTTYLTDWIKTFWSSPSQLALLNMTGNDNGLKVQTNGNYAYVIRDGGVDFLIVDLSVPAIPSVVGSLSLSGTPSNIAVSGNYAYVSSSDNSQELQVIDISSPSLPAQVGSYNAAGNANANGVYVVGTTVYLGRASSSDQELYLLNVSVPTLPTLFGSFEMGADLNEVVVIGSYAYLATASNSQEIRVVDVSIPTLPIGAGALNLSGNSDATTITGAGSVLVVGRVDNFVYVVSIASPTVPSISGSLDCLTNVNDVVFGNSNQYVFVGVNSGSSEFRVINIEIPTSPTTISTLNIGGTVQGVAYNETLDVATLVTNVNAEELVLVEAL